VDVAVVAAVVAPIATALLLIPWRSRLDTADNALFLVVAIVAVASTGRRLLALTAAVVAALSFDFFLTRPYYSFRITRHQDLITELLLLVLGIAVGELAARGRNHQREATESKESVALLHSVTGLVAAGREPREVVAAALPILQQLLRLRDCYFTRSDPGDLSARISAQGEVTTAGQRWAVEDLGLPTSRVDLPVRAQGWLLGHFVLTPTPGRSVDAQRVLTAVAIADLVGGVILADEADPVGTAGPGRPPDRDRTAGSGD
jgi:K+-sensing histidine kinase KdpD